MSWKISSQPGSEDLQHSLLSTQIWRNFIGNPGSKLLLMADGSFAVGHVLRWLVHHVECDPSRATPDRQADNRGPHWVAEDIER